MSCARDPPRGCVQQLIIKKGSSISGFAKPCTKQICTLEKWSTRVKQCRKHVLQRKRRDGFNRNRFWRSLCHLELWHLRRHVTVAHQYSTEYNHPPDPGHLYKYQRKGMWDDFFEKSWRSSNYHHLLFIKPHFDLFRYLEWVRRIIIYNFSESTQKCPKRPNRAPVSKISEFG